MGKKVRPVLTRINAKKSRLGWAPLVRALLKIKMIIWVLQQKMTSNSKLVTHSSRI